MSKKNPKKSTVKRRIPTSRESVAELKKTIAAQEKTIAAQARELLQAAEQQEATSEVLRMIATAPDNLQAVLDALAERAARLCESYDAVIQRVDGDCLIRAAHFGPVPVGEIRPIPLTRELPSGRAIIDRQTVRLDDVLSEIETEFPDVGTIQKRSGSRTVLATPLLSKGVPIGVIMIRRTEVRAFSEKHIALLKTFADQAVIAIENIRLFQQLRESLEQQTASSDILGVIARSPADIQPVLDAVAESAAKLCDSKDAFIWRRDNNVLRMAAAYGRRTIMVAAHGPKTIEGEECPPIDRSSLPGRAVVDNRTIHIEDLRTCEDEFPWAKEHGIRAGARTCLVAPLVSKGVTIGAIHIRRYEVRPFTEKQIKLLETFADQAVIAIENVRLFKQLQERNAELREARNIRRRRPKYLASLAARPRTSNRSWTPSSKAPLGFVELMMSS